MDSKKAAKARIEAISDHLAPSPSSTIENALGPSSNYYFSQRLRLHYVDWGNEEKPLLVMIHGGRDHCRNWDWSAKILRNHYHVVAPDLRGHGDSEWAKGSEYLIAEHAFDILNLVEAVGKGDEPVTIVAHSMGGTIAIHFAAIFPEKVKEMVIVEGVGGNPAIMNEWFEKDLFLKYRDWAFQLQDLAKRQVKKYPSIQSAIERMTEENPTLNHEQVHHLTVHGIMRNEDGTYSWKFDNYNRIFFPQRYSKDDQIDLFSRVKCPVLLIQGTESWVGDPSKDGRLKAFKDAVCVNIEKGGHWVHHDNFGRFMEEVQKFLFRNKK